MKNKKGFTLIELLAVIVILGLLMAIAIPSVTKYITESRKKTVISTIGNYITAMGNEINDLNYTFTGNNTIYAVPIECIALERGGTNPFGAWHQANDAYWAYVLVQYDDETSSYRYGYTFKDSAGYGLYPTTQARLNEQGKQIQTGLNLFKPKTGKVTTITDLDNWNGFAVSASTDLMVLVAESEGNTGNGETTCTLQQKGDNYEQVENDKDTNSDNDTNSNALSALIKKHNTVIEDEPTLNTSSNNTDDASGLYSSTDTIGEDITYYFRGNVTNNYVIFAGLTWRIVRINEDGTIRLILNGRIGSQGKDFNSSYDDYSYMYYSNNSNIKNELESWYDTNITDKGYDSYVSMTSFCEQAKVKSSSSYKSGNAVMTVKKSYVPSFNCIKDGNEKEVLSLKVGLITYDEIVFAGGYPSENNSEYYLKTSGSYSVWTMSPAGANSTHAFVWYLSSRGDLNTNNVNVSLGLRPVINLNANVLATGTGTSTDAYVIETK